MRHVNPIITQMKQHSEEVAKQDKALSYIHSAVTDSIFTRIMAYKAPKEAWDKLREEFHGSDKIRQIQVLNLLGEFEVLKIRKDETIKDYSDKVLKVANQLRLLGEVLSERKDLTELVNALQAYEQRRAMRHEDSVENALTARTRELRVNSSGPKRPNVKCRSCNQMGHVERVCKTKNAQTDEKAAGMEQEETEAEHLFMATSVDENRVNNIWLIDNGCSNHMTGDVRNFTFLDKSFRSKVEIGSGVYLKILGTGTVAVEHHQLISFDKMVEGIPVVTASDHLCATCQFGKQSRFSFPKSSDFRATEKLQLVHSDLGGPMQTISLSGSAYYMIFIDDFLRYCWIYFLKHKSEAYNKFIQFKALVENEAEKSLKILRTDNGKEYCSNEFKSHLARCGIKHHLTVPYSPQQNGVCEHKNRTIIAMTGCLLYDKNLPNCFWAEAANVAVSLLNVLPTTANKTKSPHEMWFGVKPSVAYLRVFGCICYSKIPDARRIKLDRKSQVTIYLGYSETSKGYRVYNVETKKVSITRDARFDEYLYWNWDSQQIEGSSNINVVSDAILGNENHEQDKDDEDFAVRGTRTLQDIYNRCNMAVVEPTTFSEASIDENWMKAMEVEIDMIKKNGTWVLFDRPSNQNIVVARHDTICLLTTLTARERRKIWHLDVKLAFLNGKLAEDIYIEQLEGFEEPGSSGKVLCTPFNIGSKLSKDDGAPKANGTVFRKLIGCLLYLIASRPDIMYATSVLSRYMQSPSEVHHTTAKRVLRYVKGTLNFGLKFSKNKSQELLGYCDSDWAGCLDDSKSTSGFCFTLGSAVFTWNSKKQECTATKLLVDNQSAIAIARNPVQYGRTKHIRVKYHALRAAVKDGEIVLEYCNTEDQLADIFTKGLPKDKFEYLRSELGVFQVSLKESGRRGITIGTLTVDSRQPLL
ncbi:Uncharacterized protein TCM_029332 [Theobroma cacao]|uniref:Integrase catalytic domain-containing protein n=1 Tax=Theobroma cacao TaxID=3641 RepID=A0A061GD46_THECC|nr:Uncharacterized protein TCM_029332 [Theobroma cacao]